ncbi:MAG: hypothetical protein ACK4RV_10415 [Caulobacter sp.]
MTTIHKFPRPAANPASSPTEGAEGAEGYPSRSSAPHHSGELIGATLEGVERQLARLIEQVADMKAAGASFARIGNLAHDAEMACFDLAALFGSAAIHAEAARCAEWDRAWSSAERMEAR